MIARYSDTAMHCSSCSVKFRSSFLSTKHTSSGANLPPKSFSETTSCFLSNTDAFNHLTPTLFIYNSVLQDMPITKYLSFIIRQFWTSYPKL